MIQKDIGYDEELTHVRIIEDDVENPLAIFRKGGSISLPEEGQLMSLRHLRDLSDGEVETLEEGGYLVEKVIHDYTLLESETEDGEFTERFLHYILLFVTSDDDETPL